VYYCFHDQLVAFTGRIACRATTSMVFYYLEIASVRVFFLGGGGWHIVPIKMKFNLTYQYFDTVDWATGGAFGL